MWIVHRGRRRLPATPAAIDAAVADGLAHGDLSRVAIAEPLFGTMRTQYSLHWQLEGA